MPLLDALATRAGGGHRSGPGEHPAWQASMMGLDALRPLPGGKEWGPPAALPAAVVALKCLRERWLGGAGAGAERGLAFTEGVLYKRLIVFAPFLSEPGHAGATDFFLRVSTGCIGLCGRSLLPSSCRLDAHFCLAAALPARVPPSPLSSQSAMFSTNVSGLRSACQWLVPGGTVARCAYYPIPRRFLGSHRIRFSL